MKVKKVKKLNWKSKKIWNNIKKKILINNFI